MKTPLHGPDLHPHAEPHGAPNLYKPELRDGDGATVWGPGTPCTQNEALALAWQELRGRQVGAVGDAWRRGEIDEIEGRRLIEAIKADVGAIIEGLVGR